jgi:hypothetical protein
MQTSRKFVPGDRYGYDFGKCNYKLGWAQIDTESDASYFGTWCNPSALLILNYCEGDETVTKCDTAAEFAAELERMRAWHIGNEGRFGVDCMCSPTIYEALGHIPGGYGFMHDDREREAYASGSSFRKSAAV